MFTVHMYQKRLLYISKQEFFILYKTELAEITIKKLKLAFFAFCSYVLFCVYLFSFLFENHCLRVFTSHITYYIHYILHTFTVHMF